MERERERNNIKLENYNMLFSFQIKQTDMNQLDTHTTVSTERARDS